MNTYKNLWPALCSYDNLEQAHKKARKRKTQKPYVIKFEEKLHENLCKLRNELLFQNYKQKPLKTFILKDPKTRKISKSHYRDRVIHHALCNIIEPIFDKTFIHDSYANRKGTLKAIERFDKFKRKASKNNTRTCYILKADVKHYFDTVDHQTLINIIKKKIQCKKTLWLIKAILSNHQTKQKGKGMPLGNLTSQFFANVYLNELDQYIKHKQRAKYYIRYVDDFTILHHNKTFLKKRKEEINQYLQENLQIELHPNKTRIRKLKQGMPFLGFRIFPHHRLLMKRNIRKMKKRMKKYREDYEKNTYDQIHASFEGWLAYAKQANTHNLRKNFIKEFEQLFPVRIARVEIDRWAKQDKY